MKEFEKKPFEECKIELIELGDDIMAVSTGGWQSGDRWHPGEEGGQGNA